MKRNKYIFLDFDGVVNNYKYIKDYVDTFVYPTEKTYYITEHIDPENIQKINRIIKETGAKVILSTAWRKAFNLDRLRQILEHRGFIGEIIDETPILNTDRFKEIQSWLDSNNINPEDIVIIDDMPDMAHLNNRFVKTSFDTGILDKHVLAAIKLLNFDKEFEDDE